MNNLTLFNKDCRHMTELADNSIQCVVTSPPYWGLRKYAGNQDLIWGGDKNCEHIWQTREMLLHNGRGDAQKSGKYSTQKPVPDMPHNDNTCQICNAWKGSFGLEPTPELYVAHSIEILRGIKRVLRPGGVVFWNIGDSYYSSGGAGGDYNKGGLKEGQPKYKQGNGKSRLNLKPKDLCLIPFRVAIAAQEDGWWIRSAIIWNKPNPMPESVTDRPTDAYEHIFMFTKSARYYWDIEAVREAQQLCSIERMKRNHFTNYDPNYPNQQPQKLHQNEPPLGDDAAEILGGRNLRNVWTFPTQPYKEAHFATFPEALPEKCIKAASKEGDIVLDPFAGSGTTLYVARKLGRKAVGYEISPQYCKLIEKRNAQAVMA